jgi:3D (Asp-Asp-Asp) domain-containing protein
MMRSFYKVCLALGAMGLPVTVAVAADGHASVNSAKGAHAVGVAPTSDPIPAPTPTRSAPAAAQPWIVITPRLPDPRDGIFVHHDEGASAPSTGIYSPPVPTYRQTALTNGQVTYSTECRPVEPREQASEAPAQHPVTVSTDRQQTASILVPRAPVTNGRKSMASNGRVTASTHDSETAAPKGRLARVTAYWASEGDYFTRRGIASTGVRLHEGHCAVDPNIIPYGSVVDIAGVGKFLAVDTGTAVIERTAAREGGRTAAERNALVIDLFFESRRDGEAFASSSAKWAAVSWWTPGSTATQAKEARSLFAEEDWTRIQNKQL